VGWGVSIVGWVWSGGGLELNKVVGKGDIGWESTRQQQEARFDPVRKAL